MLLWGDTERSAALRHEVPLAIIDPLLFAEVDGRRYVLTNTLEIERVRRAVPDTEVLDFERMGMKDLVREGMSYSEAEREIVVRAAGRLGIDSAAVPGDFPLAMGDRLREGGITVLVDEDAVALRRRCKSAAEREGIRRAQRAAEAGMAAAAALLARARPDGGGRLRVDGEMLLAEDVRRELRAACAAHGAHCGPDVIVASAWSGYGHDPGSGPLPAGLPIVIDIWPRDEHSACWADMARTFLVGRPVPELAASIAEKERLVSTALERARSAIRPGVIGRDLFALACEVFESHGYLTQRSARRADETEGFQFALGHGVGLEVHERPYLGLEARDTLIAGDVIAIEPGLWDARTGEVRLEDLVLVTEEGCETLTRFLYDIALPS